MKNLIYLVLTALIAKVLADILYAILPESLFTKLIKWLEQHVSRTIAHFLRSLWHSIRHGRVGAVLWLLGFMTVLYVLSFAVSLYLIGGVPTVDVPKHDIYVPYGQPGEVRILVEDKSFRGFLFKNVFPPASLMQLRIIPKQGYVTVLDGGSSEPTGDMILKVHQGELVVVRYSFAEGYEVGDVQVSVFGLLDNPQKDMAAQIKVIRFVRTAK